MKSEIVVKSNATPLSPKNLLEISIVYLDKLYMNLSIKRFRPNSNLVEPSMPL